MKAQNIQDDREGEDQEYPSQYPQHQRFYRKCQMKRRQAGGNHYNLGDPRALKTPAPDEAQRFSSLRNSASGRVFNTSLAVSQARRA